jgi:ethanolaminephosphotransferase
VHITNHFSTHYRLLDALDGKHARNTKMSSPMGELFDHACDSVGTSFLVLIVFKALKVEREDNLWYAVMSATVLFAMEHTDTFASADRCYI